MEVAQSADRDANRVSAERKESEELEQRTTYYLGSPTNSELPTPSLRLDV